MIVLRIAALLLFAASTLLASAQQANYNWRIGVSAGYSNYYGDLSPYPVHHITDLRPAAKLFTYNSQYVNRPSYRLTVERYLSNTTGLMFSAGNYQFSSSDRYIRGDGSLKFDAPRFDRALNFNTEVRDIGLSLVFKTDNGRFLKKSAFLAPFFTVGAGYLNFDVSGDLYDENGNPYDYSSKEQINNYDFETDLSTVRTNEEGYTTDAWYANLGLGLKFRISRRFDLNIESIFNYTSTDFLDDVGGNYPSDFDSPEQAYASAPGVKGERRGSNRHNDFYIYHGVTLKYSFGHREQSFRAPAIQNYGIDPYETDNGVYSETPREDTTAKDTAPASGINLPHTTLNVFNYAAVVQKDDSRFQEQMNEHLFELRRLLEADKVQTEKRELKKELESIGEELAELNDEQAEIESDTLTPEEVRNSKLNTLSNRKGRLSKLQNDKQQKLDSLNTVAEEIRTREIPVDSAGRGETRVIIGADTQTYYLPHGTKGSTKAARDTVFLGGSDSITKQKAVEQKPEKATPPQDDKELSDLEDRLERLERNLEKSEKRQDSLYRKLQEKDAPAAAKKADAETAPSAEVEELRREVAELRGAVQDREATSENVTVDQAEPDLSRINRNLAAQTAAISALTYAILRDDGRSDREKEELAALIAELDSSSVYDDSVAVVLDSLAHKLDSTDYKKPAADTVYRVEQKPKADDSAIIALHTRIDELSKRIGVESPAVKDEERADVQILIARIEELNRQLSEEEARRKAPTEEAESGIKRKSKIYFDVNSTAVAASDRQKIDKMLEIWRDNPDLHFQLTGYADNTGSTQYNIQLCEKRLNAVKEYILQNGSSDRTPEVNLIIGGRVVRTASPSSNPNDRRVDVVLKK